MQLCRTAALGGHVDRCDHCGHLRISYNSCRNRHCPKCQVLPRERWIMARKADLLPVRYFHLVFTLPQQFNRLCMWAPQLMYNTLFQAAWQTVKTFAEDPKHLGASTGMVAVLHTWGQNLSLHPHLHCIVPGGGLTRQGKWRKARGRGKFLFPVKAMSSVFRAKFVARMRCCLKEEGMKLSQSDYDAMFDNPWVVYAKQPFLGPEGVVEYLGRYTHKIAISNHRLLEVNERGVRFSWKDYRHGNCKRTMELSGVEFLRRFCQHILPRGFMRIRHYGILSSRVKGEKLQVAREALEASPPPSVESDWKTIAKEQLNYDPDKCPRCGKGQMIGILQFEGNRGPPDEEHLEFLVKCLMSESI